MTASSSAADSVRQRHVLVVDDLQGRRAFGLDAATYSIGRDPTNAIVLQGEGLSRQHAILLRLPGEGGYRYQIMDGNSSGKPSMNGISVNGERCTAHDLRNKDIITFANTVKAQYYITPMSDQEYAKYTQSAGFRSIKSEIVSRDDTSVFQEPL